MLDQGKRILRASLSSSEGHGQLLLLIQATSAGIAQKGSGPLSHRHPQARGERCEMDFC